MLATCSLLVASSGFLSSLICRNLGKCREMPFSGSTYGGGGGGGGGGVCRAKEIQWSVVSWEFAAVTASRLEESSVVAGYN